MNSENKIKLDKAVNDLSLASRRFCEKLHVEAIPAINNFSKQMNKIYFHYSCRGSGKWFKQ